MTGIGHNNPPPENGGGWIAIARGMRSHWLVGFGQPVKPDDESRGAHSRAEAFIDLIMECRYCAGTVSNGGVKMLLEPGQLVGAVSWLASRWNWTPQTVRTFLDKLEDDGMISRATPGTEKHNMQRGKQATVITLCNYHEYQIALYVQQHVKQQANNKQLTSTQQASNNIYKEEQGNKGTREQITSPNGEVFAPALILDDVKTSRRELDALEAFNSYNELALRVALPTCGTLTPQRRKSVMARLREHGPTSWGKALANIERSAFLRGQIKDFQVSFDWLIKPTNFGKVADGAYGNGAHAKESSPSKIDRMVDQAMSSLSAPSGLLRRIT
jgi:hypothetical protein